MKMPIPKCYLINICERTLVDLFFSNGIDDAGGTAFALLPRHQHRLKL